MKKKDKMLTPRCRYDERCHGDGLSRNGSEVCDMCSQYIHGWNDCVTYLKKYLKNFAIVDDKRKP